MVSASVYDSSLNCVLTFIQLIVEGWHSNSNKLIFETFFLFKSYKICSWTINQVLSSKYLNNSNNVVRTFLSFQKSSRMLPLGFCDLLLFYITKWDLYFLTFPKHLLA